MAKQCIGLDIGSSSVKAVQLRRKGSGWALQAFGMQPLVPQTIVDGTIMDQGAVSDAIRQLWARLKLKSKDVAIAIAGHSVLDSSRAAGLQFAVGPGQGDCVALGLFECVLETPTGQPGDRAEESKDDDGERVGRWEVKREANRIQYGDFHSCYRDRQPRSSDEWDHRHGHCCC